MNYIWCAMIIVSLVVSAVNGTVGETVNAAFDGAKESVFVVLSFAGVMCFWTGIMKIAEKSGLQDKVKRLLRPVISFLFPGAGEEAKGHIAMNMSANLLGMGNAATPEGILAMRALDRENPRPEYASRNMCMLVVINTASIQLIPTTIIALRTAAGSADPFSVVLPVWIASFTAAAVAALSARFWLK